MVTLFFLPCCVADNIEVAHLKTLTKENVMHFYTVSSTALSHDASSLFMSELRDDFVFLMLI